jgi:hypothetical protein
LQRYKDKLSNAELSPVVDEWNALVNEMCTVPASSQTHETEAARAHAVALGTERLHIALKSRMHQVVLPEADSKNPEAGHPDTARYYRDDRVKKAATAIADVVLAYKRRLERYVLYGVAQPLQLPML